MRFAWPPELHAAVTGHDLTESVNDDGSAPMRGDSWADLALVVRAEGDGRIVRFETAGRARMRSQGLAPDVGGARPVVRLDGNGRVVRVEGAPQMQARVREAHREGQLSPEQVELLLHSTSEAAQQGTAAAHWDWILGAWSGRTLACGEPVRTRVVVPALSFGNATVETESELLFRGRHACERPGGAGCVVLEARQRDVGGSAARALARAPLGADARLVGASFVRTVRVLAEPDTLVPHEVEIEERWALDWDHGQQTRRTVVDRQTYTFDYLRAPVPPPVRWIVRREGAPARRPDTPACRWVDACCEALGGTLIAQMVCVGIPRDGATDCTDDDVAAVQGVAATLDGGPPAACAAPP